jgi:hypothetical protein
MKKRQLQEESFETFLQESVKSHRMYPSDQVWNQIRTDLHGNRSWPALTFISLFIISALVVATLLNNRSNHHQLPIIPVKNLVVVNGTTPSSDLNPDEKNKSYLSSIAPDHITLTTIAAIQTAPVMDMEAPVKVVAGPAPMVSFERNTRPLVSDWSSSILAERTPVLVQLEVDNTSGASILQEVGAEENKADESITSAAAALHALETAKGNTQQTTDEFLQAFPFTGNSPVKVKNSKIGFQFYLTPSVSFRRLTDAKLKEIIQSGNTANTAANSLPISSSVPAGVNDIVRHRSSVGWELGFNVLYSITNRLQLTTGVQLNLRRYDIETFMSRTRDLTSLSLVNNRGIETISFYSPYNNNNGYRATTLHNDLYQVSAPVGIQWKVLEGKKWGLTAEASVQPTFSIQANTWLLSSDYKHYTEGNDLLRKWNINSAAGIQLTYATRSATLSVGPQVRYQHMPTYSNLYPIRENLVDYGIRMSITRAYRK